MKLRWISRSPQLQQACVPALFIAFCVSANTRSWLVYMCNCIPGACNHWFPALLFYILDITHAYIDPLNLGNNKYRYLRSVVQWYPFCTRTAAYHVSSCSLLFCVFSKPRGRYTDDGGINDKELIKVHASRVLPWVKDIVAGMDYLHRLAGYAFMLTSPEPH